MTAKEKISEIFNGRASGWCKNNCNTQSLSFNTFSCPELEDALQVVIDEETKTIILKYLGGMMIDRTTLVNIFSVGENITVFVNGQIQQSGITENDFTNSVIYELSDGENTTNWTVSYQHGL